MTSMRISSTSLIAGALVVGDSGLGVEGIDIPSTGQDGAAVLNQFVTLPADNDVEFRMLITSQPSAGTLITFEDSSFIYHAPVPTNDSFNYEWFKDGVSQGSDTVNLQIGPGGLNPPAGTVIINSVVTTTTTATVSFSYDNTDQTGFDYRLDGGSPVDIFTTNPFVISSLAPDTSFTVEVRAYNGDGDGAFSSSFPFTTDAIPVVSPGGGITLSSNINPNGITASGDISVGVTLSSNINDNGITVRGPI